MVLMITELRSALSERVKDLAEALGFAGKDRRTGDKNIADTKRT